MPALRSIVARSLHHVDALDLELPPTGDRDRRHLVLIGPSGCGKTSLLEAIAEEAQAAVEGRAHPDKLLALSRDDDPEVRERERRMAYLGRPVRLGWSREERSLPDDYAAGLLFLAHLPAPRELTFLAAGAARADRTDEPTRADARLATELVWWMAARAASIQGAQQRGDDKRANVGEAWRQRTQEGLRRVLGDPKLALTLGEVPTLDLGEQRVALDQLARGARHAVQLWAEVHLRVEGARARADRASLDPAGLVIVDTPEEGLDARAQHALLPALTSLFPRVQLVVATQSPLVALALDGAIVLDLARRKVADVEALRRGGLDGIAGPMASPRVDPGAPWRDLGAAAPAPPPARSSLPPATDIPLARVDDTMPDMPAVQRPARLGVSLDAPRRILEKQAKEASKKRRLDRKTSVPPPATLPPKEGPERTRRTTLGGPGPWNDDER